MYSHNLQLFEKFTREGVVHREGTKNNLAELKYLMDLGYVDKVRKKAAVFYQLTEKALPLLEAYRHVLLYRVQMLKQLHPRSQFYRALLEDLRFFPAQRRESRDFKFLGDWQLHRSPDKYQLALSQERFFEEEAR